MIQSWYASAFGKQIRSRGQAYYRSGAVSIVSITDDRIEAHVEGTRTYTARLVKRRGRVEISCTCPYYTDWGEACKHVWATILEAEMDPDGSDWLIETVPDDERAEQHSSEPASSSGNTKSASPESRTPARSSETSQGRNRPRARTRNKARVEEQSAARTSGSRAKPAKPAEGDSRTRPPKKGQAKSASEQGRTSPWREPLERLKRDMTEATSTRDSRGRPFRIFYVLEAYDGGLSGLGDPGDIENLWERLESVAPTRRMDALEAWYTHPSQHWRSFGTNSADLAIEMSTIRKNGTPGVRRDLSLQKREIESLPEPDREILTLLLGAESSATWSYEREKISATWTLSPTLLRILGSRLAATERFELRNFEDDTLSIPLRWEADDPWSLAVRLSEPEASSRAPLRIQAYATRRGERLDLGQVRALLPGGFFVDPEGAVSMFRQAHPDRWIETLAALDGTSVPRTDASEFVQHVISVPGGPDLDVPESFAWTEIRTAPTPCLVAATGESQTNDESESDTASIERKRDAGRKAARKYLDRTSPHSPLGIRCALSFDYEGRRVGPSNRSTRLSFPESRTVVLRDFEAEGRAANLLQALGSRVDPQRPIDSFRVETDRFPALVRELLDAGWKIEANGRHVRLSHAKSVSVRTGKDWFQVEGEASYGNGLGASLPELLRGMRKNAGLIPLGDGSYGLPPEEWIARYAMLGETGTRDGEAIRFRRSQVAFLDAVLEDDPDVDTDEPFQAVRERIRNFDGIRPASAPDSFVGKLRNYQEEALGWFEFLREFGFGGCLADDMGLGKTIMVLAMLDSRRRNGPSLAVVPRSLIFNWMEEARRFAPRMRVRDYTGPERGDIEDELARTHLVLTTYGTLRRDVAELSEVEFDYVILDEAQAIKNPRTATAKAARDLRGRQRLALSGTPVENHLRDLWSVFEFLNPGVLGSEKAFQKFVDTSPPVKPLSNLGAGNGDGGNGARSAGHWSGRGKGRSEHSASTGPFELLARTVRPFVLRRTKAEVLRDLPEKTEQTVYCDLTKRERRRYDELIEHYRKQLFSRIAKEGMNKARFSVLEALLRLRQAACHPGLIDAARNEEESAKLTLLIDRLRELHDEGHKVLVFSQFTTLLGIVRTRLEQEGIPFEYLDGKTRKRAERVERFQNDSKLTAFLISLKAGGVGLNLTAAGYVFLLDPWWNPAVESQAIDRTHRIGQTRPVLACRLVARNTVEERILEMQQTKRELADAVIRADRGLVQSLTREDLEHLLS